MAESQVKLYPYRWVVLATFMLVNVMVQVLLAGSGTLMFTLKESPKMQGQNAEASFQKR